MRHNPMYMSDYVEHLDNVLKATGEKIFHQWSRNILQQ